MPLRDVLTDAAHRRPALTAFGLLLVVFAVYLINPDPMWSGDMNSNSVFAFNLLENGTLHLDAQRESHIYKSTGGFSFTTSPINGHITLSYPVGAAVVTFPLYALFYVWLKLFAPGVGLMTADFEPYRIAFSHIAAAALSAGTVTLFYLIVRRRFTARAALISTACLAFATMQWGLLSQSLLQQSPSSFVFVAAAFLLLRAGHRSRGGLLAMAGALAGLLYLIRPTNLVFMAALVLFAALQFRRNTLAFFAGLAMTTLLSVAWNWFYWDSLTGPATVFQAHSYVFTLATFISGMLGLTLGPNQGVLINSAVILLALPGMALATRRFFQRRRLPPSDLLFLILLGASGVLFASYSFSPFWDGGVYGSRYVSETMPVLCYFLNLTPTVRARRQKGAIILALLFIIGSFNQLTAVLGGHSALAAWASIPYGMQDLPQDRRRDYMREAPLRSFETRRWNVRDGLNERIWRGLYSRRLMPQTNATFVRHERCRASIVSIADSSGRPLNGVLPLPDGLRPYADRLWEEFSAGRKFVHARIRNDGEVPLYGYQSGLVWGYAAIAHKVFTESGQAIYENGTVYISGIIRPGETGDALGSMEFPLIKGRYSIEGRVTVNGIGHCGAPSYLGSITIE